ncbi:MAG: cobalamin-binding protein [Gemmatimonadaceae bacterium]
MNGRPCRVVSLLPAATEFVAALGYADTLVGITHECDFPEHVVATLPRVTDGVVDGAGTPAAIDEALRSAVNAGRPLFTLRAERIAGLRPDLMLTQAVCAVCAVREEDVRALATRLLPVPSVVTLSASSLDGMLADGAAVARALSCDAGWLQLRGSLTKRMDSIHSTLKAARAPRPRVAVIEWTDPVFAAGHWVPEMVHRAGGRDMLARAGEHSTVRSIAEVAAADPEVVVVAPCGYSLARAEQEGRRLVRSSAWAWLHERDVWAIDANALVSRPGPRLIDGVETFSRLLHPALFGAPHGHEARRLGG